ncbi:MAG TPA: 4-carboxy-4-hydroxy-2-oxoadipate aldolase/oxaloacetate decarboxylase [Verrucomicrobiae bacterium]|nr:4-carboxy-4-hydroxy-2-oxoadipate aldolase/oxaloacetate decarboxylase [Verrucomicrobiae bacterium]
MKPRVVRNIERPDPELVKKLGEYGVATVHEAQGRVGLMLPYMRPIYAEARIASPAVTVLCHPGDNLMFHAAIEVCKPGDALVVSTFSDSTDGFFGELLATSCRAHGIKGLVIHAGVRDVADLTAMQFPAFSRAISAQGTVKETPGYVNIDITCAGALVHPGDIIVADVDGVVVVPRQDAAEVVRACEARLAKEAKNRERLKAGELGLDMYSLREKLKNLGVEWV